MTQDESEACYEGSAAKAARAVPETALLAEPEHS